MPDEKRTIVVLPAYSAANTLRRTVQQISPEIVDAIILTGDASQDKTFELAQEPGQYVIRHGYGANQKTCYAAAMARSAGAFAATSRL